MTVAYIMIVFTIIIIFYMALCKEENNKPKINLNESVHIVCKKDTSELKKQAKSTLQDLGYSATEAKNLLKDIEADTVENYVNSAMKKVKI